MQLLRTHTQTHTLILAHKHIDIEVLFPQFARSLQSILFVCENSLTSQICAAGMWVKVCGKAHPVSSISVFENVHRTKARERKRETEI